MKRLTCLILLLIGTTMVITGCFDKREIDQLSYVMALGFDEGTANKVRITIQYANPKNIGSGAEGGGGGGKPLQVMTIDAPTMYSAFNMMNVSLGKEINISQAKVMVFSKKLAEQGIANYLHGVVRGREFRPNLALVVSRTTAEEYIKSVNPIQEIDPSKYYGLNYSSYRFTGFTADTGFVNVLSGMKSLCIQPVAVLAGVDRFKSTQELKKGTSTAPAKGEKAILEGDYKAGDVPKVGDVKG
ncbi:MAG TPA: Ger(x)C family spore germination protein, partial [Bacillota bacterium]|nr:Ger(x)C family spore germination protein [Bacillota bacterium]